MGHKTLTRRLNNDEELSSVIVSTFLQGSYRRATAVKPKNNKRADVDIIVVTTLNKDELTPEEAINKFEPFVKKYYDGKYKINGRSIGIKLSYVDLDIVITSAPSEAAQKELRAESVTTEFSLEDLNNDWRLVNSWAEPNHRSYWSSLFEQSVRNAVEWKSEPLWIPDRDAKCWVQTNPLEQIRWTRDKNKNTNTHFINVVKAIKWWRTSKLTDLKYPKGYPIEHMVGDCCPDNITSVEEGIVKTLEGIVTIYSIDRILERTPILWDRGVDDHNVWKRVDPEDFVAFYDYVKDAAKTARKAFDSVKETDWHDNWRKLFGSEFPPVSEEQARAESLADKSNALRSGQAKVGQNVNIVFGGSGVSVPKERNHYDDKSLL